jgi:hypothetical protein
MLLDLNTKQAAHMSSRGLRTDASTGTVGSNRVGPCIFGLVCAQADFRVIMSLPVLLVSGDEDEKRFRHLAADAMQGATSCLANEPADAISV